MSRKFVGGDLAKLTGLDADTGLDQLDWDSRIHPEDAERISLPGLNGTRSQSMEYRWSGTDKKVRHFLDQCVRIDDGSSVGRWAGTLVDITEQKLLEAQLLHSRKMDAIGQLTGGVAHDFNNLLSAVLGGLHLLERRLPMEEREKELIRQMRHAAEQGAELVRRMMAFARKQELIPTSVDPHSLCTTVAGLVEHTLGGTVKVEWSCSKTQHNLFVDRSQLELALVNLIINARDAMPQGGNVEVEIRDVDTDEIPTDLGLLPGSYVVVSVRDQGEGIPDEIVSRVTEPFFTTKEAGKGTGLGLSMVVGFVQQSGGKLRIESTPGEGSTIEVYLPSTPQPALDHKPGTKPQPALRSVSKAVLLVDDDDAVRAILGEQLRELGLRVDAVPNGSSAVERLKERGVQYDVLLTDFAMPGINGLETISLARVEQPELHALLMTGYADEEAVASARSHVPVIRKPIDLDELMRQIG
jgi:signal transduction histidine kinase/CheY-like chemotaxis protein